MLFSATYSRIFFARDGRLGEARIRFTTLAEGLALLSRLKNQKPSAHAKPIKARAITISRISPLIWSPCPYHVLMVPSLYFDIATPRNLLCCILADLYAPQ